MENNIATMKVGTPSILGTSTINHAARVELGLNASEYVLMDYIYRRIVKKEGLDITETYRQTGYIASEQERLLNRLIEKGFVFPINCDPPQITDKWRSAFANINIEFDELIWMKNDKVFFPGNKKTARSAYIKLRKKYSRDFMIEQRDHYARLIKLENSRGFPRQVMIATRFFGPKEEFLNDWKNEANIIEKLINNGVVKIEKSLEKQEKTQTVTSEERKKIYEQDSNK